MPHHTDTVSPFETSVRYAMETIEFFVAKHGLTKGTHKAAMITDGAVYTEAYARLFD